jgi:peptide/nickel transport system permease protein
VKPTVAAAVLIGALVTVALAAPWLTPYPPNLSLDIIALRSQPPSWAHPFGTDSFSRDVMSRVLFGARVSLAVSLASVLVGLVVGIMYGAATAFSGPTAGRLLRRLNDVLLSIPRLLVLLAVTAVASPLSVPGLILLVGLTGWFVTARQVADELDALRTREFSLAAQALGVRTPRLLQRHLLPHLLPVLVVTGTFGVANTIGLEAGLSFLGLGIQPPTASWGTILRDGTASVRGSWWITLFPCLATILAVLACNAVGDVLRERFSPDHVASSSSAPLPSSPRA